MTSRKFLRRLARERHGTAPQVSVVLGILAGVVLAVEGVILLSTRQLGYRLMVPSTYSAIGLSILLMLENAHGHLAFAHKVREGTRKVGERPPRMVPLVCISLLSVALYATTRASLGWTSHWAASPLLWALRPLIAGSIFASTFWMIYIVRIGSRVTHYVPWGLIMSAAVVLLTAHVEPGGTVGLMLRTSELATPGYAKEALLDFLSEARQTITWILSAAIAVVAWVLLQNFRYSEKSSGHVGAQIVLEQNLMGFAWIVVGLALTIAFISRSVEQARNLLLQSVGG